MEYQIFFPVFISFLALVLPFIFLPKTKKHHQLTPNPSMAAEPDWSQLPAELLHLISERLNSPLYLLRFRSVCSAWRSSASATIPNLNFPFTFPPLSTQKDYTFSLSKRVLFLITPPTQTQTPWLVKIGQDLGGRTRLWHPLFRDPRFPSPSPRALDLYNLPVFHLGNEFVLGHPLLPPSPSGSVYMEKVVAAATWRGKQQSSVVLFTIHISGRLALICSGDEDWTVIPDMPTPYDDVCVFNGRPCAVDSTGQTVAVRPDLALDLVAEPVFGGDKKFLVESQGRLLLVDKHLSADDFCSSGDLHDYDEDDDVYGVGWEKAVRFDVFRLDEKERRWVQVTSLGDQVLFLGDDCAFSASASDLGVGRGNCVVFRDDALKCQIGVFPLDEGRISPLSDYPAYSRLFSPPPDWARLN